MRWENLFDDLEGQLEVELGAEELDLGAEEERLRLGRLGLRERLVTLLRDPEPVQFWLRGAHSACLRMTAAGRDWVAGDLEGAGAERIAAIVPLSAITSVVPTPDQLARSIRPEPSAGSAAESAASLAARLGLSFVLRDLCRRRAPVDLTTTSAVFHGTIDRVGRDHLDLAEHEVGVPRRMASVARIRIVPADELVLVRF
jgi:hypothetical protein